MKKIVIFTILTYITFATNSLVISEEKNKLNDEKNLNIGVLLPLSGEFQNIGESFLKSIELALYDIGNKKIKIYPMDSKANALDTYLAAKEFEKKGIKIVIGPVFFSSLERLNEINNITFISLTNKTAGIPKNTIAFGVNINSQIKVINEFFIKNKISKTLLLAPREQFINQVDIVKKSEIKINKNYSYDINPKKITAEIEKITKYRERKKDLDRRIKILEKSDLYKHKQELKILEQQHTLGRVNFDSVIVIDFGERLKSVLTSFMFSDVSSKNVNFFTVNQWFDKTFFNESALLNLHFPSINISNFNKFNKKFIKKFNKEPAEISILAYDALALIFYCWSSNNFQFKRDQLFDKKGFKGKHAEFVIENNISMQKLKVYKVTKKKFIKVY